MKLQQLTEPDRIFLGLQAEDGDQALTKLGELLSDQLGIAQEKIVNALKERERLGSTGVGDGFAIPHCKLPNLKEIVVAIARFEQGVDFHAPDGAPVRLMFVVLSPPDQPAAHLQVLSQIARVLKRKEIRRRLMEAEDAAAVAKVVGESAEAEGL